MVIEKKDKPEDKWYRNISKENSATIWRLVALFIIAVTLFFALNCMMNNLPDLGEEENTIRLPLLVLFGVISFLGALTIAAAVLHFFKLSNPSEALGLPPGSVRALIALSLILIFALMVIFMSSNLAEIKKYEYVANSTTGNFTVIYGGKEYTTVNGTLTLLVGPSEAAINFSNQVLTTVSTLVVALAGFYFGTRSVAQAQQITQQVNITLEPKSPHKYTLTEKDDKVEITATTKPENEIVKAEIIDDNGKKGSIRAISENKFEYKPPTVSEPTKISLKFYMLKYPNDIEEWIITINPAKTDTTTDTTEELKLEIKSPGTSVEIAEGESKEVVLKAPPNKKIKIDVNEKKAKVTPVPNKENTYKIEIKKGVKADETFPVKFFLEEKTDEAKTINVKVTKKT